MNARLLFSSIFWRSALLALCLLMSAHRLIAQTPTQTPTPAPKPTPAKIQTLTAAEYRAKLERVEENLAQRKGGAPVADVRKIVGGLGNKYRIKRADGATQISEGNAWQRRLNNSGNRFSRFQIRDMQQELQEQREALDAWAKPQGDSYYEPAEARRIIGQLEGSGQIRTGPTAGQKWWGDLSKKLSTAWDNFVKSLSGWFNSKAPATTPNVPSIDTRWITFFFYSCVLSLLAIIGWLVWRSLGGKFGRSSARREVRYLQGEDAELLLLPPDELLARSHRFAQQGEYREALRHRFLSLLMRLDSMGVWRYDTRRTNWEHIAALRREPKHAPLVPGISDLTRSFDRVRYGDAICSGHEWQQFDNLAAHTEDRASGAAQNTSIQVSTQVAGGKP